MLLMTEEVLLH